MLAGSDDLGLMLFLEREVCLGGLEWLFKLDDRHSPDHVSRRVEKPADNQRTVSRSLSSFPNLIITVKFLNVVFKRHDRKKEKGGEPRKRTVQVLGR